jgi:hypothetical protein
LQFKLREWDIFLLWASKWFVVAVTLRCDPFDVSISCHIEVRWRLILQREEGKVQGMQRSQ